MILLGKSTRTNDGKDTLVILHDAASLRDIELERSDRQYLAEQLKGFFSKFKPTIVFGHFFGFAFNDIGLKSVN